MCQHLATEAQLVTFFEVSSNFGYSVSNTVSKHKRKVTHEVCYTKMHIVLQHQSKGCESTGLK